MANDYKIWQLVDQSEIPASLDASPIGLDYKTGLSIRLHPELTLIKGELVKVEYYRKYDGDAFIDKILTVDIDWTRSDSGTLIKRTETRRWLLESEVEEYGEHVKVTEKYYNEATAAQADIRRRQNIINDLIPRAARYGIQSYIQTMFRSLDNEKNAYIDTGDTKLMEKIGTYSGAWLEAEVPEIGATIRQYIIGALTI